MNAHVMNNMDRTGHTTITWDASKPFEIDLAKDAFDKAIKEGYSAFRVVGADGQGDRITKFDPKAGKIMMVPHLVGG